MRACEGSQMRVSHSHCVRVGNHGLGNSSLGTRGVGLCSQNTTRVTRTLYSQMHFPPFSTDIDAANKQPLCSDDMSLVPRY